ncbi:hypothetical protein [Soonwooa sp.]|uniref:hypothetical protein n=1 Tax=Soonwooa sp. TaxID=1938592 RepID=UPI0026202CAB|nr:hypothetical protein [Soonwooa sp.]
MPITTTTIIIPRKFVIPRHEESHQVLSLASPNLRFPRNEESQQAKKEVHVHSRYDTDKVWIKHAYCMINA